MVILPLGTSKGRPHSFSLDSTLACTPNREAKPKEVLSSKLHQVRDGFPSLPQGTNTCLVVHHKRCFSSLLFIINNRALWQTCIFLSIDLGHTCLYPSLLFPSNLIYLCQDTVCLRLVPRSSFLFPRIGSSQKMALYRIFKWKRKKVLNCQLPFL